MKLTPIVLEYQPDLDCTLALIHDGEEVKVVKLTDADINDLEHQIQKYKKLKEGTAQVNQVDVVKGIKPSQEPEQEEKITIPSKLYQGFMHLETENKKLKKRVRMLENFINRQTNKPTQDE